MTDITVIDHSGSPRVESGPLQFGEDWPGLFIRGDEALHYMITLEMLLMALRNKQEPDALGMAALDGLKNLLASVRT